MTESLSVDDDLVTRLFRVGMMPARVIAWVIAWFRSQNMEPFSVVRSRKLTELPAREETLYRSPVELAVLHDGEQVVSIKQYFRIIKRVTCDQQQIGKEPWLNLSQLMG